MSRLAFLNRYGTKRLVDFWGCGHFPVWHTDAGAGASKFNESPFQAVFEEADGQYFSGDF